MSAYFYDETPGTLYTGTVGSLWIERLLHHYREFLLRNDATLSQHYAVFSIIVWWSFVRRSPLVQVHKVLKLLGTSKSPLSYLARSSQ